MAIQKDRFIKIRSEGKAALSLLAVCAIGQAAVVAEQARVVGADGCPIIECPGHPDLPGEGGAGTPYRGPSITIGSSTAPGVPGAVPSSVFVSVGPQPYVDVPASVFRSVAS